MTALRERLSPPALRPRLQAGAGAVRAFAATPYAWIVGAYVLLRLGGFVQVEPVAYPDSQGYFEVASHPVWSLDFLAGARPWTVPLLYKVLPDSDQWRAWGQFVLSVACWPVLGWAVARCVRPGVFRYVAFGAVLVFSMSTSVIQWDTIMLSESVSISLTALVVAGWLELVRAPRPWTVVALLVATLLWVFARDSNGVIALLLVPVVVAWAIWWPGALGRRWLGALAGGLLAIFLLSFLATTTDSAQLRRNQRPILHVIGRRVLVTPAEESFFRAHGMPAPPPRVIAQRKYLAGIAEGGLPSDPASDRFIAWAREHGRGVLARYLLLHPARTLKPVYANRKRLLSGVTVGYKSPNARTIVPEPIAPLVYPRDVQDVWFWLVVVVLAALGVWRLVGARAVWLVPAAALALQVPHAIVVYHGDTLEIPRHAILVAVMTRLSVLLLALFVVDAVLNRKSARTRRMFDGRSSVAP